MATSRPHDHDLLAFQDEHRSFETPLGDPEKSRVDIFKYDRFLRSRIYPYQRALTDDREIICVSSFDGLCLYRADGHLLENDVQAGRSTCEALIFGRRLAELTDRKMFIEPAPVLRPPKDHSKQSFLRLHGGGFGSCSPSICAGEIVGQICSLRDARRRA